jgi:hypothetical protein
MPATGLHFFKQILQDDFHGVYVWEEAGETWPQENTGPRLHTTLCGSSRRPLVPTDLSGESGDVLVVLTSAKMETGPVRAARFPTEQASLCRGPQAVFS